MFGRGVLLSPASFGNRKSYGSTFANRVSDEFRDSTSTGGHDSFRKRTARARHHKHVDLTLARLTGSNRSRTKSSFYRGWPTMWSSPSSNTINRETSRRAQSGRGAQSSRVRMILELANNVTSSRQLRGGARGVTRSDPPMVALVDAQRGKPRGALFYAMRGQNGLCPQSHAISTSSSPASLHLCPQYSWPEGTSQVHGICLHFFLSELAI